MPDNQNALKRYRIILKILSKEGSISSKFIHQVCLNSGIEAAYRTIQKDLEDLRTDHTIFGGSLGIQKKEKEKNVLVPGFPNMMICRAFKFLSNYKATYLIFDQRILCNLTAFNIAKNATPTSANTASHIVAIPPAPKMSTMALTPKARVMFCHTIRRVERPILIALPTLLGWSV